ncbi:MAG: DUF5081 family protein [Clostridium sp.]|jgi:hypothetical protein|nr:DUF5081 family protein [Clostridium sp.]
MNIKEIYVLNRALDGKDIPFMPSFKDMNISEIMIEAIKDGMINKGLLTNYQEFSIEGLKVTDRLRRYKEAKKHIKLNRMLMGLESETQSVVIFWNPIFKEYSISVIKTAMGAEQIAENYNFLTDDIKDESDYSETLEYDEFAKKFTLDYKANFRLTSQFANTKKDEVFLKADGKLYVYDCLEQVLHSTSRKNIVNILKERMSL